jgi:hypothetical protein
VADTPVVRTPFSARRAVASRALEASVTVPLAVYRPGDDTPSVHVVRDVVPFPSFRLPPNPADQVHPGSACHDPVTESP